MKTTLRPHSPDAADEPPVEIVREARTAMLVEWRMDFFSPVGPIPDLNLCVGQPRCDGSSPETCRACFCVPVNDGRGTVEIMRAWRIWKRQ